jgi:hypothetical protein
MDLNAMNSALSSLASASVLAARKAERFAEAHPKLAAQRARATPRDERIRELLYLWAVQDHHYRDPGADRWQATPALAGWTLEDMTDVLGPRLARRHDRVDELRAAYFDCTVEDAQRLFPQCLADELMVRRVTEMVRLQFAGRAGAAGEN